MSNELKEYDGEKIENSFSELARLLFCNHGDPQLEVISHLIEKGAVFNKEDAIFLNNQKKMDALLFQCAMADDAKLNLVSMLLLHGASVDASDEKNIPLLACLCLQEYPKSEIIACLLENKANIDLWSNNQFNLFYYVCIQKNPNFDIISSFIKHGANPNETFHGKSLLYYLCARKKPHLELIAYLIQQGANPNQVDKNNDSLLVQLMDFNGICSFIIDLYHKGYRDLSDYWIFSDKRFNPDLIKCLVDHGADINIKNKQGSSLCLKPFYDCIHERLGINRNNMIRFIRYGLVDVNFWDDEHECTLFHYVLNKSSIMDYSIIQALLEQGAKLNVLNQYGHTPIHTLFIEYRYLYSPKPFILSAIPLFIQYGADINAENAYGETCLDIVCSQDEPDVELLGHLLLHGASPKILEKYAPKLMRDCIQNLNMKLALLLVSYCDIDCYSIFRNDQGNLIEQLIATMKKSICRSEIQSEIKENLMFYHDIQTGFSYASKTIQSQIIHWMMIRDQIKKYDKRGALLAPPKFLNFQIIVSFLQTPKEIIGNISIGENYFARNKRHLEFAEQNIIPMLEYKANLLRARHPMPAAVLDEAIQQIRMIRPSRKTHNVNAAIEIILKEAQQNPHIQKHRGAKQILMNCLLSLSIVGLLYLAITQKNRHSFWYRPETKTESMIESCRDLLSGEQPLGQMF